MVGVNRKLIHGFTDGGGILKKIRFKMSRKMKIDILTILIFILIIVLFLGASWLVTCGLTKLVTLLIGIDFSWSLGTLCWIVAFVLGCFAVRKE